MTALMEAHAFLTKILDSYVLAWQLKATEERAEAQKLREASQGLFANSADEQAAEKCEIRAKLLDDRLRLVVKSHFLQLTKAEMAEPELAELIAMAKRAGRFQQID